MVDEAIQFFRFRPNEASEVEFDDLIDLLTAEFSENNPQDPSPPRSGSRRSIETLEDNDFNVPYVYLIRTMDNSAVGMLQFFLSSPKSPDYEKQKHVGYMVIYLVTDKRKHGIGKQALHFVTELASENGVTVLEFGTSIDAGKEFAKRAGATIGLKDSYVRVQMADIDWQMIEDWNQSGQERNPDTQMTPFMGLYSEDETELARFCAFVSAIRADIPDGDLEGFVMSVTPERLRNEHELESKQGRTSTYMMTVEADGRFSGFTRINHRADFGHYIGQRVTGVLSAERGRGLGKWLKAAMLLHIRENYPNIEFIRTSYANTNDPMISINERIPVCHNR